MHTTTMTTVEKNNKRTQDDDDNNNNKLHPRQTKQQYKCDAKQNFRTYTQPRAAAAAVCMFGAVSLALIQTPIY